LEAVSTSAVTEDRGGEARLVEAVLRKDRKATAEFVERFADAIYNYVHWRLYPATDAAEDLVQDVFLDAWRGLERYRGDAALTAWLLGIARHKVQDYYRKALRTVELPDDPGAASEHPEFERALADRQQEARIQQVLAELPETYRVVLLWRYWDGQSGAQIAAAIGRTEKAVERLLARAREQFRARYGAEA
jgi:RNA polymerase sigma-70 factor (ECF subfamily)